MKTDEQYTAPPNLYPLIKGHFIINGSSVTDWCSRNEVKLQNLKAAISGAWKGPKAEALIKKAIKDSGVRLEGMA